MDRAQAAIDDILSRGRLPVVVGGTMMYLQWLVHGKPDAPKKVTPSVDHGVATRAANRVPILCDTCAIRTVLRTKPLRRLGHAPSGGRAMVLRCRLLCSQINTKVLQTNVKYQHKLHEDLHVPEGVTLCSRLTWSYCCRCGTPPHLAVRGVLGGAGPCCGTSSGGGATPLPRAWGLGWGFEGASG